MLAYKTIVVPVGLLTNTFRPLPLSETLEWWPIFDHAWV